MRSFVETRGRNLEEIDEIFNDPNPVKKSLEKTRMTVTVDEHDEVVVRHS